jgi:hypothetical protein
MLATISVILTVDSFSSISLLCSITVAVPVVTPQKETPPSRKILPTDNKFDLTEKIFSAPAILFDTILFFVTAWLQRVLGYKRLRDVGIKVKDIKTKCKIAHQKLSEGQRETKLHFTPERKRKRLAAVVVLVTASNMIDLQSYDLKSSLGQAVCDNLIKVGHTKLESTIPPESTALPISTESIRPVIDVNESQCFVLPFTTSNHSLLQADRASLELSTRLEGLICNQNLSAVSGYFENSLRDNVGKKLVIHGMDFATLEPEECLNDAVLSFWFKWVSIPRTSTDDTSNVHICSTYLLSGVVNDGYNSSYQRWLKNVDIFKKKIVLFPVHFAHHWSLIAVLNPGLIRQTQKRWGDRSYTREVTSIIHLDPLGNGTVHNKQHLGRAVRDILNKEWDRYCKNRLDQLERPFNHRYEACKLHSPAGECLPLRIFIVSVNY